MTVSDGGWPSTLSSIRTIVEMKVQSRHLEAPAPASAVVEIVAHPSSPTTINRLITHTSPGSYPNHPPTGGESVEKCGRLISKRKSISFGTIVSILVWIGEMSVRRTTPNFRSDNAVASKASNASTIDVARHTAFPEFASGIEQLLQTSPMASEVVYQDYGIRGCGRNVKGLLQ